MLLDRVPPNGTRKSPGQVEIISQRGQSRKFSPGRGLEKRLGSRFYQENAKTEKGNAVKGNAVRIRNGTRFSAITQIPADAAGIFAF
jgi:hypothetical protein